MLFKNYFNIYNSCVAAEIEVIKNKSILPKLSLLVGTGVWFLGSRDSIPNHTSTLFPQQTLMVHES